MFAVKYTSGIFEPRLPDNFVLEFSIFQARLLVTIAQLVPTKQTSSNFLPAPQGNSRKNNRGASEELFLDLNGHGKIECRASADSQTQVEVMINPLQLEGTVVPYNHRNVRVCQHNEISFPLAESVGKAYTLIRAALNMCLGLQQKLDALVYAFE